VLTTEEHRQQAREAEVRRSLPLDPDLLQRLEDWRQRSKAHAIRIECDDGFGGGGWEITLTESRGVDHLTIEQCYDDGDWEGLARTLQRALEAVE